MPVVESREMVQFYMNNENETWDMMSVSPEPTNEWIHISTGSS